MPIAVTVFIATTLSVLGTLLIEKTAVMASVLGGFLRLTLSENPGVAFGLSLPYPLQEILIGIALFTMLVLAYKTCHSRFSSVGFGLILGGAIGNLIDRIPDGLVTDYFAVGTFPVFNIADACITIGAGMLLMQSMKKESILPR